MRTREIKFRIWDGTTYFFPEANRKAANHYLQFGSEGFWLYNSDGKLVASTTEEDICEQFTGMKDNNGKEIYEGDIIYSECNGNGVVQWNNDNSCFEVFVEDNAEDDRCFFVLSYGEIIGNINQNPELL